MNKRIKELLEQADKRVADNGLVGLGGVEWCNVQLEIFAELIILECCNILNDNRYSQFETVRNLIPALSNELKREFGVE